MVTLLIYTPVLSRRLQYIVNEIFERILGFEVALTTSKEDYINSHLPRINYSHTPLVEPELYIIPQGLLSEQGVNPLHGTLLPLSPPMGDSFTDYCPPIEQAEQRITIQEDILATAFYLLSRYEEYQPFQGDIHGRFTAKQSLAYRQGFLQRPLVNEWTIELVHLLARLFPNIKYKKSDFHHLKTYDIDQAYRYRNKGFFRTLGAFAKNINNDNQERLAVLTAQKEDPFDTFGLLEKWHDTDATDTAFFVLLGDYGEYDKNINHRNSHFRAIIKRLSAKYQIGIHPSYQSNLGHSEESITQLLKEKLRLENIINQPVIHSRQHFLKLKLPTTYEHLLSVGIQHDYSMGYADELGFRASVATPYYWYDLRREETSSLMIHPFQVMDVTLKDYLMLTPSAALKQSLQIKNSIKNLGGTFTTLWHNSSFDKEWLGWKEIYEEIIKK